MRNIQRRAKDLQIGDYLPMTKQTVISTPVRGLRTPPRKHEIRLCRDNGVERTATWGSYTLILVTVNP